MAPDSLTLHSFLAYRQNECLVIGQLFHFIRSHQNVLPTDSPPQGKNGIPKNPSGKYIGVNAALKNNPPSSF
jgi:hypothetical protein